MNLTKDRDIKNKSYMLLGISKETAFHLSKIMNYDFHFKTMGNNMTQVKELSKLNTLDG